MTYRMGYYTRHTAAAYRIILQKKTTVIMFVCFMHANHY